MPTTRSQHKREKQQQLAAPLGTILSSHIGNEDLRGEILTHLDDKSFMNASLVCNGAYSATRTLWALTARKEAARQQSAAAFEVYFATIVSDLNFRLQRNSLQDWHRKRDLALALIDAEENWVLRRFEKIHEMILTVSHIQDLDDQAKMAQLIAANKEIDEIKKMRQMKACDLLRGPEVE